MTARDTGFKPEQEEEPRTSHTRKMEESLMSKMLGKKQLKYERTWGEGREAGVGRGPPQPGCMGCREGLGFYP